MLVSHKIRYPKEQSNPTYMSLLGSSDSEKYLSLFFCMVLISLKGYFFSVRIEPRKTNFFRSLMAEWCFLQLNTFSG